jgi:hypothetical protein
MKSRFVFALLLLLLPLVADGQEIPRCFHLDKIQFLHLDASFWKKHNIALAANKPSSLVPKYFNVTELDAGIGLRDISVPYSKRFYGITTINGAMWQKRFGLGLGLGADSYNDGWLIPVFGDARYYFDLGLVSIFAVADGGVKFSPKDFSNESRVFVSPGVGVALPLTLTSKIVFSTGLLSQWQLGEKHRDSFINFRLGILFKGK